jgi:steroid delta-isomerase-like uncharacterized protein
MSDQTEAIERLLADYNRHDGAAFASHFTEDGVLRFVVGGEIAKGREEIQAAMEEVWRAIPDWKLAPRDLHDCGADAVWLPWTITGTIEGEFRGIPPTHRRFEMLGCSHFTFGANNLVVQDDVYHDALTLLGALGVLPDPEATQSA